MSYTANPPISRHNNTAIHLLKNYSYLTHKYMSLVFIDQKSWNSKITNKSFSSYQNSGIMYFTLYNF